MQDTVIHTSDPRACYRAMQAEIDEAIRSVLDDPGYILGEAVSRFEQEFSRYVGVGFGVGMNNGTDAIHLALRALGVGIGDEVITVSHTAVATVAAIRMSGATPVLADVDPMTRTIDPNEALKLISPRTKAMVVVHLYGHPAAMDDLVPLCREHGIFLVEDCAQAHGARFNGRMVGGFGQLATFSFYPTKNLGAIGDAGMVVTNDPDLADKLTLLRQYGWTRPQYSTIEGWNSRLDPIQAAILSVKLRKLDEHTERRRQLAQRYQEALSGSELRLPTQRDGGEHVYHLYVVELKDENSRDNLREHLIKAGVNAGIHYPFGVHEQPAYKNWIRTGSMSVTERLTRTVLSLPLYPELSDVQQDQVIDAVRKFPHYP